MGESSLPYDRFISAVNQFVGELDEISDLYVNIANEIDAAANVVEEISTLYPQIMNEIARLRMNQKPAEPVQSSPVPSNEADEPIQPILSDSQESSRENSPEVGHFQQPSSSDFPVHRESSYAKMLKQDEMSSSSELARTAEIPEVLRTDKTKIPEARLSAGYSNLAGARGRGNSTTTSPSRSMPSISENSEEEGVEPVHLNPGDGQHKERAIDSGIKIRISAPSPPEGEHEEGNKKEESVSGQEDNEMYRGIVPGEELVAPQPVRPLVAPEIEIPAEHKDGKEQVSPRNPQLSPRQNKRQRSDSSKSPVSEDEKKAKQEEAKDRRAIEEMTQKVQAYVDFQTPLRMGMTLHKRLASPPLLYEIIVYTQNSPHGAQSAGRIVRYLNERHDHHKSANEKKLALFYLAIGKVNQPKHCYEVIMEDFTYILTKKTDCEQIELEHQYYHLVCEEKRWQHLSHIACRCLGIPSVSTSDYKKHMKDGFLRLIADHLERYIKIKSGELDMSKMDEETQGLYKYSIDCHNEKKPTPDGLNFFRERMIVHEKEKDSIESQLLVEFYRYLLKAKDQHRMLPHDASLLRNFKLKTQNFIQVEFKYFLMVLGLSEWP